MIYVLTILLCSFVEKAPVPDATDQKEAVATVREVFGAEWKAAKTKQQRQELSHKLIAKALVSQTPSNQYVLLRIARDMAEQNLDGVTAFKAIDEMDSRYKIDSLAMKKDVLKKFAEKARHSTEHKFIAEHALGLVDDAVVLDDFDSASYLATMALSSAKKARSAELVKKATAQNTQLKEFAAAFEKVKGAIEVLKDNPKDVEANTIVGKYRCLVKDDWANGLPMLALGSDPLKTLAEKDLNGFGTFDSIERVSIGDGWWNLGLTEKGLAKEQYQQRALFWYKQALPGLTGLAKDKVEGRVKGDEEKPKTKPTKPGKITLAQILVANNFYRHKTGYTVFYDFHANGTVTPVINGKRHPTLYWRLSNGILTVVRDKSTIWGVLRFNEARRQWESTNGDQAIYLRFVQ